MSAPTGRLVISEARERVLRAALRVALGVVLLLVLGCGLAIADLVRHRATNPSGTSYLAALLGISALVLLFTARAALRLLPARDEVARRWALSSGALTLLAALPLLTGFLGVVVVAVGLFLLTAAWPRDRL
ncbi:MAG: hypothetical protein R2731_18040 [Nocardioides sp.]